MRTLLKGCRVPVGEKFEKRDVLLIDGLVTDISPDLPDVPGSRVFFLHGCHLLPGLCDIHVHLREPGFSAKETVATGTRAAAQGGFTAVCAMPNVEPPPDTPAHLALQQAIIAGGAVVPTLPYGTLTLGRRGEEVVDMPALAGQVAAFSDDGSGVQSAAVMERALRLAESCGALVCAHCEDERVRPGGMIHAGAAARRYGLPGIPAAREWKQLRRDIELVRKTGARYHACHISCKQSVALIRAAKAQGLPVSCETAPHYLALCDEDVRDEGRFKMSPPIRAAADRNALVRGLIDGAIDAVATDHAPHTAREKSGGLAHSLNGVVGLETAFAVCYTALVKTGRMPLAALVRRMCHTPRRLVGMPENALEVGRPLDAAAMALDSAWVVEPNRFAGMGRSSPFAGAALYGKTMATWAGGRLVYSALNGGGEEARP